MVPFASVEASARRVLSDKTRRADASTLANSSHVPKVEFVEFAQRLFFHFGQRLFDEFARGVGMHAPVFAEVLRDLPFLVGLGLVCAAFVIAVGAFLARRKRPATTSTEQERP